MIKIFSTEQTREADAYTINHEPIDSIDLMERASKSFVDAFTGIHDTSRAVWVFCGTGNNGGDGLAIARMLKKRDYKVRTWTFASSSASKDHQINLERLSVGGNIAEISGEEDIPEIPADVIVIDALFGSGLSRPVSGLYATLIDAINSSGAQVVSVDIPSGVYGDAAVDGEHVIIAAHTLSFQFPKLAFLLSENHKFIGEWVITDIGLHPQIISDTDPKRYLIESPDVRKLIKKRDKFSHKGNYGRGLLIAGSYGKMGAVVLASRACLRSGIGLLTAYVPGCGYKILQTSVPELMVETDGEVDFLAYPPEMDNLDVLGIGPGMGRHKLTAQFLGDILRNFDKPIVLDADALNLIGEHREYLRLIPQGSILTPHVKELERLTAPARNDFHRLELLGKLAADHGLFVILKGAHSVLADPDGNLYFNRTGNPGMATAGSGDVLTGILTALLARYDPRNAAILGVYLHGLAGDKAADHLGQESMIAGDIITHLPEAFKDLS